MCRLGDVHPLRDNPFFVLELPPTATPMEIERQGKKLLSMLELDLQKSLTFASPYGPQLRTAERIREAVQLLLDPARRLPFEPWASASFAGPAPPTTTSEQPLGSVDDPTTAVADPQGHVWWQP